MPFVGAFVIALFFASVFAFVLASVFGLFFALFFALSPGGVDTFTEGDKVISLGLGAVFAVEARV